MQLTQNDLRILSQCAVSAAFQAGRVILEHAKQSIAVATKEGGTSYAAQVVTEVDHLSQDIILNALLPTCDHFDVALLSEENPDNKKRLEKDFFWCIDPLDGTLPFIETKSGYSVSIALVNKAGMPMIGVVYDPVTHTLYRALKGEGAFMNNQVFECALPFNRNALTLTFISDISFAQDTVFDFVKRHLDTIATSLGYKDANLILQGGAAMNACQVINCRPACYFKFPKDKPGGGSIWDYAATACIFNELNLPVSDIFGQNLNLNPQGSTFLNHCGVLYASDIHLARKMIEFYSTVRK